MLKTKNVEGIVFVDYPSMTPNDWETEWREAIDEINAPFEVSGKGFDVFLDIERRMKRLAGVSAAFACTHDPNQTDWSLLISEKYFPKADEAEARFYQNEDVFAACQKAFKEGDDWTPSQKKLAEDTLRDFVTSGCGLTPEKKKRLLEITEEMATLKVDFQSCLSGANSETVSFPMSDLSGLDPDVLAACRKEDDSCEFTLIRNNIDFLMSSKNRDVREKTYLASQARNKDKFPTYQLCQQILRLRREIAEIMGEPNFATFDLSDKMAKTPENVEDLLSRVWVGAKEKAQSEFAEVAALAADDGVTEMKPWDIFYYTEKTKQKVAQMGTSDLSPYLSFEKVERLAFDSAKDLLGVEFVQDQSIPLYHPSCTGYLVKKDGQAIGGMIMDYQKRPGKGPGAWMNSMVEQSIVFDQKPVVINVSSFYDGDNKKASLNLLDATTVFHELGHALHGLLSNVDYMSQSGTHVARDFVELPSQLFENWLTSEQGLVRAGIPDDLVQKTLVMQRWGVCMQKMQYLASAFFDLSIHAGEVSPEKTPDDWSRDILKKIDAPSWLEPWHAIERFSHIWDGGYEASYYSYLWAEVIEADMFSLFTQNLFDEDGKRVVQKLYSSGGSVNEEELFESLMGRPLSTRPFLARFGLAEKRITM